VRAPMGGMGDSGLGRRHGAEGILKYTESQSVAEQRLVPMGSAARATPRAWVSRVVVTASTNSSAPA
ncbi:hypothetical protein, partial [Streptomyces hainanensis]